MNNKNNIDALVGRKMANADLGSDEAQWAGVQSFIAHKKKKKRRAIVYWSVGLLLLISSSFLVLNNYLNTSNIPVIVSNTDPENSNYVSGNEQNPTSNTPTEHTTKREELGSDQGENTRSTYSGSQNDSAHLDLSAETASHLNTSSKGQNTKGSSNEYKASKGGTPELEHHTTLYDDPNKKKPRKEIAFEIGIGINGSPTKDAPEGQKDPNGTSDPDQAVTTLEAPSQVTSKASAGRNKEDEGSKTETSHTLETKETTETDKTINSAKDLEPPIDTTDGLKAVTNRSNDIEEEDSHSSVDTINSNPLPDSLDLHTPVDSIALPDTPHTNIVAIDSLDSLQKTDSLPAIAALDSILPKKDRGLKGFFLTPYMGPSLSQSILKGDKTDLLEKRKAEEEAPWALDLGLTGRYYFKNQLYVGTGIGYFEMGENANYSGFNKVTSRQVADPYYTYQDSSYLAYTDWDSVSHPFPQVVYTQYKWVEELDSTLVPREKTVFDSIFVEGKKVQNRFSYLEVPLVIGYHIPVRKWSFGLDAGTGLNFLLSVKGNHPDLENARYNPLVKSQYRFISQSFISNFSVGRRLGEHWVVNGNMRFRRQLNTAEKVNDGIRSKYQSVGFQFKVNYQW